MLFRVFPDRLLVCAFVACALVASPVFAQTPQPAPSDTPAILHARSELDRVKDMVTSGVLPRVRLEEAQAALDDALDAASIRSALYAKDITVPQADALVDLTAKRLDRRQKLVDDRNKLVAEGILARSEVADSESALEQAKLDHNWAVQRAQLARQMVELVKNEEALMHQMEIDSASHATSGLVEHFVGSNRFDMSQFPAIEKAFEQRFSHPLPVSAMGETETHKSRGFDHRNRVDIALQPDQPEGQWLRTYLTTHNIPFFAFRSAIARQATGAHIHIGPPSQRYVAQNGHVTAGGL